MNGSTARREVVVVAPDDRLSRLLVEALAGRPEVAACRFVAAPAPGGYLEPLHPPGGGAIVVYRPPRAGRRSSLPDRADAEALLAACSELRPVALVLVASAAVVEPRPDHAGLTAEPARLGVVRHPIARAWAELEELAAARLATLPATALIVLRPAAVALAGGDEFLSRLLGGRFAVVPLGFDPVLQLLAPADLVAAVCKAVAAAAAGGTGEAQASAAAGSVTAYQVAPAGVVPMRAALRLAGVWRIPVPLTVQRLVRAPAARLGWTYPAAQVNYLRDPSTVSGEKIRRELGFAPAATSAAAIAGAFAPARRRRAAAGSGGAPPPAPPAARELDDDPHHRLAAGVDDPAPAPEFDDYGLDRRYIAAYGRTLFRFLHRHYWRIETSGLEHVPRAGAGVLVGVHRGFMPWDGVMLLHTLVESRGRYPRFLIHPTLVKFPFLAPYMTKLGGMLACQENADWVLSRGELLGMFPEGIRGAFTMYRDAYRLGKFGRDEYVRMALRHGAPLIPFVTAGSAEIYPILGKIHWHWWQRYSEWPFLPLTPTFPWLPFPLPSKWHTRFLAPLALAPRYPPEAADDPETVRAISNEIRGRMQEALDDLRRRRRSIFYGNIFTAEETARGRVG